MDELYSHHPNIGSVEKLRIDDKGHIIDNVPYESFNEPNHEKQFSNIKNGF